MAKKSKKNIVLGGKPQWLKVKAPSSVEYLKTKKVVKTHGLHTVCESASCPNVGQCWHEGAAAFMILGNICTRHCSFCDVTTGRPDPIDLNEPERLAQAAKAMDLQHVVITSVDRDDLDDGGAGHFANCIKKLRKLKKPPTIEVLTPDFRNKNGALQLVLNEKPEVFNHNIETVPRLYTKVRPAANYNYSLKVLEQAALADEEITAKSGIMLGLGESLEEVFEVLEDMHRVGVQYLTVGQYIRPSLIHHPVIKYWSPQEFSELGESAIKMGFQRVESHPLARSSYHAKK
ncbi:MAG: lipoyl synthase [Magnetococcales bacterium]|nr:lipoyl synthase [Magnetococcales bacterium]